MDRVACRSPGFGGEEWNEDQGMTLSTSSTENVQVLQRYLDAINGWNFAAMRELLHPDISYELPYAPSAFPRLTRGLDDVMTFLESVPGFAAEENLSDIVINQFLDGRGRAGR